MISKLIKICYLILFFLTPLIFLPTASELFEFPKILFLYALTVIIVGLHLINVFSGNSRLFKRNPLNLPLLLFLLSQAVATFFSIDKHTSIFGYYSRFNGGLLSTISYISLYFVINSYIDSKFVKNLIRTSLISGLLVAAFGIAEHFGIDKNYWVQDVQSRVFSTLGQPNWLSAYLCILIPLSLYFFIQSKTLFLRFFYHILTFIFFLCLLFTKSKTGIFAASFSLFIFFVIYLIKEKTKTAFFISASTVTILLVFSLAINNPIKDKIFPPKLEIGNYEIRNSLNITPSEDIRKLVWAGAFALWQKFPLFGTGTETFAYSYYWTRPAAHNLTSEWDFLYNKAHNEYLNYLATTGTIGLVTYLIIIVIVILNVVKNLSHQDYLPSLAILSSFITILITNATGFSVVITSLYFFLLLSFLSTPPIPKTTENINKTALVIFSIAIIFLLIKIFAYLQADLAYNVATSYDDQGYYSDALKKIDFSVSVFPDEPVYLIKAADIATKNALVAFQKKDLPQAKIFAKSAQKSSAKALAISPANINFYKEQAQMYYYLSTIDTKYFPQAITSLKIATTLAPTDAKSFYILGKFWSAVDKNDEAIASYQKALELKSNYDYAAFALGELYYQQKDYKQAKNYFELTLKLAPNNTDAQNYLKKISKI